MLVCATDKDSLSSETHETDRSSCSQPFDLLCQVLRAEWHRADSARSILPVFQLSAQRRAPQLFSGRAVDETAVAPRANLCRCLHPIHGYGTRIDGNRAPHVYLAQEAASMCAFRLSRARHACSNTRCEVAGQVSRDVSSVEDVEPH
jgi:hypothetical protein